MATNRVPVQTTSLSWVFATDAWSGTGLQPFAVVAGDGLAGDGSGVTSMLGLGDMVADAGATGLAVAAAALAEGDGEGFVDAQPARTMATMGPIHRRRVRWGAVGRITMAGNSISSCRRC
jgi:hypothetical protein